MSESKGLFYYNGHCKCKDDCVYPYCDCQPKIDNVCRCKNSVQAENCDIKCGHSEEPKPAAPTAQWQKEAEEMYPILKEGIQALDAIARQQAHVKCRELLNAQHAAHMEQVQREVDDSVDSLQTLLRFIIEEMHPDLEELVIEQFTRLRTITQTKTSE